jgi:hypothetical protein
MMLRKRVLVYNDSEPERDGHDRDSHGNMVWHPSTWWFAKGCGLAVMIAPVTAEP